MADETEPLTFNSRSKSPYDKFSNFYEAKIEMPEGVFGSVEHYFHAMKFIDGNHSRFEVNGDLGKQKHQSKNWKDTVSKGRFIKSAGGKSGTKQYKLTLRSDGLDRERAKQKMKQGLERKFVAEPFRSLLLDTRSRELVHTPMRGSTDYWTGRVDKKTGKISGENNMGKLLMEVRLELQRAEQYIQNEENKDEIEKNEVVDEKEGDTEMDDNDTTQDSSGYQGTKRKHEDDNVDVKHDEEEPDGPKIKRKKTETESKRKTGSSEIKDKSEDENKGDDRNNAVEKNTGHEVAKRKHQDDYVQVKDVKGEHRGPKVK